MTASISVALRVLMRPAVRTVTGWEYAFATDPLDAASKDRSQGSQKFAVHHLSNGRSGCAEGTLS